VGVINDPASYLNKVNMLERELLNDLSRPNLEAVEYDDIHTFLTAKGWNELAIGLFDRWFLAYSSTEEGSKKIAQLEVYKLMHDADERGETPDHTAIALFTEIRRRIRSDEEFRKMLSAGVSKGEITLDYLDTLTTNIWRKPEAATA
jgi:hypothetical protein